MTISAAAEQFLVSPRSIHRWIKAGRLEAITLPSGHKRIRRAEVEHILAGEPVDTAVISP